MMSDISGMVYSKLCFWDSDPLRLSCRRGENGETGMVELRHDTVINGLVIRLPNPFASAVEVARTLWQIQQVLVLVRADALIMERRMRHGSVYTHFHDGSLRVEIAWMPRQMHLSSSPVSSAYFDDPMSIPVLPDQSRRVTVRFDMRSCCPEAPDVFEAGVVLFGVQRKSLMEGPLPGSMIPVDSEEGHP